MRGLRSIVAVLLTFGATAAWGAGLVDLQPEGPASASVLAVSADGEARNDCATGPCPVPGGLVAASGTGNAYGGTLSASGTGTAWCTKETLPCFSVGGGAAHAFWGAVSVWGPATAARPDGGYAVSVFGNAGERERAFEHAVSGSGDAYATSYAVSGTGDAECVRSGGCNAFSLTGDASSPGEKGRVLSVTGTCEHRRCFAVEPTTDADGVWIGVSGTGSADGHRAGVSALGDASSWDHAVAGTGDSFCRDERYYQNCHALSGTGDADGGTALSAGGSATSRYCYGVVVVCVGMPAVAGLGNTSAPTECAFHGVCVGGAAVTAAGQGSGAVAVSAVGDARGDRCTVYVVCGAVAVSGTEDASTRSTCRFALVCVPGVAVSGTGHASGNGMYVSGCDTLRLVGRNEACLDPA